MVPNTTKVPTDHASSSSGSGGEVEDDTEDDKATEEKNTKTTNKETRNKKGKDKQLHWDTNVFHEAFGHPSETAMRATAKHCGWKSTGKFEACEACQRSNVQQKRIKKTTDDQETKPGERLFADMSSASEHTSLGGAKVWPCVVDDAAGHCWNCTMKRKAQSPKRLLTLIKSSNN